MSGSSHFFLSAVWRVVAFCHSGRCGQVLTGSGNVGSHYCSMRTTLDVRKYVAEQGFSEHEALKEGMEKRAATSQGKAELRIVTDEN